MADARFVERMVLVVAILGTAMTYLDQTAVNVALPAIQRSLNADIGDLQWIVDIYLLTLSVLLLLGGVLGDIYGRIKVYKIGVALFVGASLLCGLSVNPILLIVGRFLQGVGGAVMVPASLAVINVSVAPERRGKMLGTWATFSPLVTMAGPVLGGWLVDSFSWRSVFFLNVPLGIVAYYVAHNYVPDSRDETISPKLDWPGTIALMIGLAGVLFGLIEGPNLGWTSGWVLGGLVIGTLSLVGFIVIELNVPNPLIPLSLFRQRTFAGVNLLTLVLYAGLGAPFFFITLFLQQVQDYPASLAGLAVLPLAITIFLLSRAVGSLADRIGAKPILTVGILITVVGFLLFLRPGEASGYWTSWFPAILVYSIGLGGIVVPVTTMALGALPQRQSGIASGVNNAASRIGQMLSIAVFGAVMLSWFRSGLAARAEILGLSAATRESLQTGAASLAGLELPAGLAPEVAIAVQQAIHWSYIDGFRVVMLMSAGLALLSVLILIFMIDNEIATIPASEPATLTE